MGCSKVKGIAIAILPSPLFFFLTDKFVSTVSVQLNELTSGSFIEKKLLSMGVVLFVYQFFLNRYPLLQRISHPPPPRWKQNTLSKQSLPVSCAPAESSYSCSSAAGDQRLRSAPLWPVVKHPWWVHTKHFDLLTVSLYSTSQLESGYSNTFITSEEFMNKKPKTTF